MLDAGADAAVACGVLTSGFLAFYAIPASFAKMLFDSRWREKAVASWGTPSPPFMYGGLNQYGLPVAGLASDALNTQGAGARQDRDGENAAGFSFCPTGILQDAEFTELQLPWMYLFRNRHMADNHGLGKYRGGSGVMIGYVPHNVPWLVCGSSQGGNKFPPEKGLFGGYAAMTAPAVSVTGSDLAQMFADSSDKIPYDVYELLEKRAIQGDYAIESMIRPSARCLATISSSCPRWAAAATATSSSAIPNWWPRTSRPASPVPGPPRTCTEWSTTRIPSAWTLKRPPRPGTTSARPASCRGRPYAEFKEGVVTEATRGQIIKRYGDWPEP